jgi:hypothetical protein
MSEKNSSHSEVNASDVTIDVAASKVEDSDNLGDGITTEQQVVAAQIEETKREIARTLGKLAIEREKKVQELQKPTTNVATTGLVFSGLATAAGIAADKLGNAASAAKQLLENTAKAVSGAATGEDIRNIINTKVKGKLGENTDLLNKMSDAITLGNAKLIDKKGIEATVKGIGERIAHKAGKIADEVMKGTEEGNKITEIITGALTEKGWLGRTKEAANPVLVNSAKSSVEEIINNRNKLLEPTKDLTDAFREKMPSFIVKPVDFYKTIPGGIAKDVGVIVGIGLLVAGIHHAMTSKEREERKKAENDVKEYSQAIAQGQEIVVSLTRQEKEIKGKFSGAVVNETASSRVLG